MVDFAQVKAATPIEALIPFLSLQGEQKGDQWRGPCPACNSGGKRALVITPARQGFYCFAQKQGGDAIALVSHIKGIQARDAAIEISNFMGLSEPRSGTGQTTDRSSQPVNPLERVLGYIQPEHETIQALGIEPDFARDWQIGYAPRGTLAGRILIGMHTTQLVGFAGYKEGDFKYPDSIPLHEVIYPSHKLDAGEARIVSNPLEVVQSFAMGIQALCFLTESVRPTQMANLASLLDTKGCEIIF